MKPARPIRAAPTLSGLIVGAPAFEIAVAEGSTNPRAVDVITPTAATDDGEATTSALAELVIEVADFVDLGIPEVTVAISS